MPKARQIPVPHPGETLLDDFMEPLGIKASYRVAKDIGVAPAAHRSNHPAASAP